MTNYSKETSLSKLQKLILIIFGFLLTLGLLFFKFNFLPSNDLDKLARNSIKPEIALSNGIPSIFEFYADWCEACREMAPSMNALATSSQNKVDVVLLNVDNPVWSDLIDKYDVTGIPQLNFFDKKGDLIGYSIGVRTENELVKIFNSLENHNDLPSIQGIGLKTNLDARYIELDQGLTNKSLPSPRSHS